ncbi:MAG: ester cyclase [bacterium]|nr:ester cyclase [bacterium]
MPIEENKAQARRDFEEVWSEGRIDLIDEYVAPDFIHHDPATPGGASTGIEGYKQLVTMYRTVFPDLRFTVEEIVGEGDLIVVRWTARGTHKAELMGIPATNKAISITGMSMSRVVDGKLSEAWLNWDALGLLGQIGAFPSPG